MLSSTGATAAAFTLDGVRNAPPPSSETSDVSARQAGSCAVALGLVTGEYYTMDTSITRRRICSFVLLKMLGL